MRHLEHPGTGGLDPELAVDPPEAPPELTDYAEDRCPVDHLYTTAERLALVLRPRKDRP